MRAYFAIVAVAAAALVWPAPAGAAPGEPQAAMPRVAVAPLAGLDEGASGVAAVQTLVVQGAGSVKGFTVVPEKELKAAIKKSKRKELEACEGDLHCLAELGRLVGAAFVIAGEVGELGDEQIAYLKAIEVAGEKEIGTTTAVFPVDPSARQTEARAAAYRLLAPNAYTGTLQLAIDVPGAVIYLDGRKVAKSPAGPLVVSVGTHALRVTHEQYRDFVRFVDVKFDEVTPLEVPLKAFPVVRDEMVQHQKKRKPPAGPTAPRPWYRKWWAVTAFGAAAFIGTALIVGATADVIDRDGDVTVGGR